MVRQITPQKGKLLKVNNRGTSKTSVGNVFVLLVLLILNSYLIAQSLTLLTLIKYLFIENKKSAFCIFQSRPQKPHFKVLLEDKTLEIPRVCLFLWFFSLFNLEPFRSVFGWRKCRICFHMFQFNKWCHINKKILLLFEMSYDYV